VRQRVRRCLQQKQRVILTSNEPSILDLTSNGDGSSLLTTMTAMMTTSSGPSNPKPKCKQVRWTASAVHKWRTNNLKAKRHKSNAHSAAVRLYVAEKKKAERHVTPASSSGHHIEVQRVPERCVNLPLCEAGTRQHIPNEDGSRRPYFNNGIQARMPGVLQPCVHQPDEHMRRQQFPEDDDPNDRGKVMALSRGWVF
jgi:hypothetical protein